MEQALLQANGYYENISDATFYINEWVIGEFIIEIDEDCIIYAEGVFATDFSIFEGEVSIL